MTSPESRSTLAQLRWESKAALSAADFAVRFAIVCCRLAEAVSECAHCTLRFLASFTRRAVDALTSGTPEPPMRDGIGRMNRASYERMIAENIEWLEQQPRTLERDHVIAIVKASADHEYGAGTPEPAPATCATCQYAGSASEGTARVLSPGVARARARGLIPPSPRRCERC
jgi:hypothetical protein